MVVVFLLGDIQPSVIINSVSIGAGYMHWLGFVAQHPRCQQCANNINCKIMIEKIVDFFIFIACPSSNWKRQFFALVSCLRFELLLSVLLICSVGRLVQERTSSLGTNDGIIFTFAVSFGLLIATICRLFPRARTLITIAIFSSTVFGSLAAWAIAQNFSGFTYRGLVRWVGPFDNPNMFGMLMGLSLVSLVSGWTALSISRIGSLGIRNWVNCIFGGFALILLNGLFRSFSRGAWCATFVGLFYLALSSRHHFTATRRQYTIFGIVCILVVGFSLRFSGQHAVLGQRLLSVFNRFDLSWGNRVSVIPDALAAIGDSPLVGHGWSNSLNVFIDWYKHPLLLEGGALLTNGWLLIGVTLGLPGLLIPAVLAIGSIFPMRASGDCRTDSSLEDYHETIKSGAQACVALLYVNIALDGLLSQWFPIFSFFGLVSVIYKPSKFFPANEYFQGWNRLSSGSIISGLSVILLILVTVKETRIHPFSNIVIWNMDRGEWIAASLPRKGGPFFPIVFSSYAKTPMMGIGSKLREISGEGIAAFALHSQDGTNSQLFLRLLVDLQDSRRINSGPVHWQKETIIDDSRFVDNFTSLQPKWKDSYGERSCIRLHEWIGTEKSDMALEEYLPAVVGWNLPREEWRTSIYRSDLGWGSEAAGWRTTLWRACWPRVRTETNALSAARKVVAFIETRIRLSTGQAATDVKAVWLTQSGDEEAIRRLSIAACRSVGIPARLNQQGVPEYLSEMNWTQLPTKLTIQSVD